MLKPNFRPRLMKKNVLKRRKIKLNEKNYKHQEMPLPLLNRPLWKNKRKRRKKKQHKQKLTMKSKPSRLRKLRPKLRR